MTSAIPAVMAIIADEEHRRRIEEDEEWEREWEKMSPEDKVAWLERRRRSRSYE